MNNNNRIISVPATPVKNTNGSNSSISSIEQVLIDGDLSKLSASDRLNYYQRVCESLGLNPLTKPFDYLKNKKTGALTLYANKDCAAQLRRIYGVSIAKCDTEIKDGIFVVTVVATNAAGQADCDIGCVPIKNLQGEEMANAMMRAVTKAKRRATLSLCGLGWLDESEVGSIESLQPAPEPKQLKATPIPDPKIQTLKERLLELKWTPAQFKQCLDINFPGKNSLAELSELELRDIQDFLDTFETTSLELQRLGWTPEQGKDLLLVHFGKETRSSLTFLELAELLKILQAQ